MIQRYPTPPYPPPNDFFHRIYGSGYKKIKDLPNASVYAYGIPANGAARVIRYTPFFDVEVLLNDIHLNTAQMYAEPEAGIEINYCRYGSFSCTMRDGSNVHLSAGDFSAHSLQNTHKTSVFPIGCYQGITVLIKPSFFAQKNLAPYFPHTEYTEVLQNLYTQDSLFLLKHSAFMQNSFAGLYIVPDNIMLPYLKIKIAELLLYLGTQNDGIHQQKEFFNKINCGIVRSIRRFMEAHPDIHLTHDELAEKFGIAKTTMKRCYKTLYGKSIYADLKQLRFTKAAEALRTSSATITDIAFRSGYASTAKFSDAFKKIYHLSPSEYRKMCVRMDKDGLNSKDS